MTLDREHVDILDIEVTPLNAHELLSYIDEVVGAGEGIRVVGHNLHSVYLYHSVPAFKRFYDDADVVLVDGAPVLAALNRSRSKGKRKRFSSETRIGSTDWIGKIGSAQSVHRVALIGSSPASNSGAVKALLSNNPQLQVLGIPGAGWSDQMLETAMSKIAEFKPDVLLIGLGMPLQESVASAVSLSQPSMVIATVGGAIDQLSGAQKNAPRWLGRLGLEWMWRLTSQPRRLWHRYLVEPAMLAVLLLKKKGKS